MDRAIVGGEADDVDASWEDGVDGNWMRGWCATIDGLTQGIENCELGIEN